jgi:hypothetical protein
MRSDANNEDASARSLADAASLARRGFLRKAWIPPVIIAVGLPRAGYAVNVSGTSGARSDNGDGTRADHGREKVHENSRAEHSNSGVRGSR